MTATETEQPGVRRNDRGEMVLSLASLRPKPRWLEIPTGDGDVATVKIPGGLSLDTMLELKEFETQLQAADATDATAIDALERFIALLNGLITESNPDLPDDFHLELGIAEATHLLIFIAQPDDSIAEAFAKAITAGDADKPDGVNDDARALARAAGLEDEEGAETAAPLPSTKRSSSRSSRSAKRTTGSRSGGKTRAARSRRSASTSSSLSAKRANANDD